MSKKDYIAIAQTIGTAISERPDDPHGEIYAMGAAIAYGLADYCAQDNPRFDRMRFLAACGI